MTRKPSLFHKSVQRSRRGGVSSSSLMRHRRSSMPEKGGYKEHADGKKIARGARRGRASSLTKVEVKCGQ